MDESAHKWLVRIATVLAVAWVAWSLYDLNSGSSSPLTQELAAAARYLEDEQYTSAIASYEKAQEIAPGHTGALRGKAQALMQLGARKELAAYREEKEKYLLEARDYYQAALENYDSAIDAELAKGPTTTSRSILGVSFANRGIVKDRMGDYQGALSDYQRAMELEPEVSEGPGFLTRFLRNQAQKPPTIADRVAYLQQQLSLPPQKRQLKQVEEDAKQRAYKM